MASEIGKLIKNARRAHSLTLRELARRIGKSPAYLVALETGKEQPGISEETLESLAKKLNLDLDALIASAKKTPQKLAPRSSTQVALYRLIGKLPQERQEKLKKQLEKELETGKLKISKYGKG